MQTTMGEISKMIDELDGLLAERDLDASAVAMYPHMDQGGRSVTFDRLRARIERPSSSASAPTPLPRRPMRFTIVPPLAEMDA